MSIDQKAHAVQALREADNKIAEAQNFIKAATPLAFQLESFKQLDKLRMKLEKVRGEIGMMQL